MIFRLRALRIASRPLREKSSAPWRHVEAYSHGRTLNENFRALKTNPDLSVLSEDLAFLPEDSEYFELYWNEMNYCIEFALANRKLMMEQAKEAFKENLDVEFFDFINKPHNFADREEHFGETVIVHRKGATRARRGEWGMIPGPQGTRSYLVQGKGNKESFESCSHGAGRVMSRAQARKTLDLEEQKRFLTDQGILHGIRHQQDLDEPPASYKNIEMVMSNQKDLVDVKIELQPLAVIKA